MPTQPIRKSERQAQMANKKAEMIAWNLGQGLNSERARGHTTPEPECGFVKKQSKAMMTAIANKIRALCGWGEKRKRPK